MQPGMTSRNLLLGFFTTLIFHTTARITSSITDYTGVESPISTGTCESRSINYVTALPNFESVCYRQRRSDSIAVTTAAPSRSHTDEIVSGEDGVSVTDLITAQEATTTSTSTTSGVSQGTPTAVSGTEHVAANHETEDVFSDASFLSFEDWKKQIIEKTQGDIDDVREGERRRKSEINHETLDSIGDDHEIDIDFGAFLEDSRDNKTRQSQNDDKPAKQAQDTQVDDGKPERPRRRSKDAGKTCKERTNFASFDSGAQVMKANREAKSKSALLSENRDVYMLNTCSANKFIVVELSDSILVETVGLANFEFFSSTFREFRISVSDRYPVKLDRWVDLGTFEAKNSREIQAFLIEDPRVWARYLRIEFLTQYGNEFYCPVSLLRVHGRTMIQDILSMEQSAGADDDDEVEDNLREAEGEKLMPDSVAEVVKEEIKMAEDLKVAQAALQGLIQTAESIALDTLNDALHSSRILEAQHILQSASIESMTTPWNAHSSELENLFNQLQWFSMCYSSETPTGIVGSSTIPTQSAASQSIIITDMSASANATTTHSRDGSLPTMEGDLTDVSSPVITHTPAIETKSQITQSDEEQTVSVNSSAAAAAQNSTATATNRTSSTFSAHASQPTTQESFFKTVSKRLQLLEQNSTLSLKYIEEQSKHLREAFNKVERRQLSKTTSFLENLNATVFAELRQFSKQYDQIWQSTVFELESQRDLLGRETAAMSSRLTLLADELVFQKRMAIVQSVLLLLCLGLVLFSRLLPGGIELPQGHGIDAKTQGELDHGFDSVTGSPVQYLVATTSPRRRRPWSSMANLNQRPRDFQSQVDSPPTPFSGFSEVEDEYTYEGEELLGDLPSPAGSPDNERQIGRLSRSYFGMAAGDVPDAELMPAFTSDSRIGPNGQATPECEDSVTRYDSEGEHNNDPRRIALADGPQTRVAGDSPTRPLGPSLEAGEPRMFSVARKPLPALPKES